MKNRQKVFNIGFHKTGTTSLTWLMHENDFHSLHSTAYNMERLHLGTQNDPGEDDGVQVNLEQLIDHELLDSLNQEYDFFSDNPWPLLFKRLDTLFPENKFILTRRSVDSWATSIMNYSGNQRTRMSKMIHGYGNPSGHIKRYREVYLKHNRDVLHHFKGKSNFLVIDIEDDNLIISESPKSVLGMNTSTTVFRNTNRAR